MKPRLLSGLLIALITALSACQVPHQKTELNPLQTSEQSDIAFEKFTLKNGLEVIFHIDKSDPVTAVSLAAHVGSAREVAGRTGFAHLFEHLLFLESENLGKGGLDEMSARIGGSGANGFTSRDETNYFQTVPKDALEKMIWAEADKLGWFINTVTQPVLEKEKQVVKNEKRQRIDNVPYGHLNYVIDKHLYPKDHPYSWQVIGSLEDLQAATLEDVHRFFKHWYVPNNVTLVVAGDFDPVQARAWVHKYFDEIPTGDPIAPLAKQPAILNDHIYLKYEDNFAQQPLLAISWPGVHLYHPDAYALVYLTALLSEGKESPLYHVLVEEMQLSSDVYFASRENEIAGQIDLRVKAYDGVDLDLVIAGVEKAFAKFEQEGISTPAMQRIRAKLEKSYYQGISSSLDKAFQLAQFNLIADKPELINQQLASLLAVSEQDIMRVYRQYVQTKPFVSASFVPKGESDLALANAATVDVVEEQIIQNSEASFDLSAKAAYTPTPSAFDRSKEPPYGQPPLVPVANVWQQSTANNIQLFGIEDRELPLVSLQLKIAGGQLLEDIENSGVASLTAQMLKLGTVKRTKEDFDAALELIGANVQVYGDKTEIIIAADGLSKYTTELISLLTEMVLMPSFDEQEFERLKIQTIDTIKTNQSYPEEIADQLFMQLLYGGSSAYAYDPLGTIKTIEQVTVNDVKQFYARHFSPANTTIHVVGAVSEQRLMQEITPLAQQWDTPEVELTRPKAVDVVRASRLYFYDVPGAKQSQIRIGKLAMPASDASFLEAQIANYNLGSGGFASKLTQTLRSEKGYTYGIRGRFSGNAYTGVYQIESGVRANVTLESLQLIVSILRDYPLAFSERDLAATQSYFIKSSARRFESLDSKLTLLENISQFGRSADYIAKRNERVMQMTVADIASLSLNHMNIDDMIILVVGDAETQLPRLDALGMGKPVQLN